MRHAKSSWDQHGLADFERPLNGRGEAAAPRMAVEINDRGYIPDSIVSSSAERAMQTAGLVKKFGEFECEILPDQRIYAASVNSLLYVIAEFENSSKNVLMVGHNPGFEGLFELLTGKYRRMPTAAFGVIEFEIESWDKIKPGIGRTLDFLVPKELS
jgi:phosphohistidine phosphatase